MRRRSGSRSTTTAISRAAQRRRRDDRRGARGVDEEPVPQVQHPGDDLTPGDDFGMMKEVLTRRFKRLLKEDPDRKQRVSGPTSAD